jgi:arsenate reductase-like glutaredoxin family protein
VRQLAPDVEERNYVKVALTADEIGAIVDAAGSVAAVLNTRHETAKANGWKEKPPTRAAFVAAAAKENNLLRRPIVIRGKRVVVGNDPDALRDLLG